MSCKNHLTEETINTVELTASAPMPIQAHDTVQEAVQAIMQAGNSFTMTDIQRALKKAISPKSLEQQVKAAVQSGLASGTLIATPVVTPDGKEDIAYSRKPGGSASAKVVSAMGPLPVPIQQVYSSAKTQVSGGNVPGVDTFRWEEYRKDKDPRNQPYAGRTVEIDGKEYSFGAEIAVAPDKSNVSCLRRGNPPLIAPIRGGKWKVGHNVPVAVNLLTKSVVVETEDGIVELYDQDGHNLLAVYNPATRVAGDTDGSRCMSPASVAAYLAYRALHPEDIKDQGFITDLTAAIKGEGTMAAAIDSASCLMNDTNSKARCISFGGQVGTRRCPDCGRFMGDAHVCPISQKEPEIAPQNVIEKADESIQVIQQAQSQAAQDPAFVPAADFVPIMEKMNDIMASLAQGQQQLAAGQIMLQQQIANLQNGAGVTAVMKESVPAEPKERQKVERGRPLRPPKTEQERIFGKITLKAPDLYLKEVPENMGGNRTEPVFENIPEVDEDYYVSDETREIMELFAALIKSGESARGNTGWSRAFGLYGMPGTGKNELARQMAASIRTVDEDGNIRQGIGVVEVTVERNSMAEDFLGGTAIKNGETVVSLPPFAEAAARGAVICINEIVRNPTLATIFQSVIEDGYFIPTGVHGKPIKVHPSTIFVFTWNPGLEGDSERPALAPLRRMTTHEMTRPSVMELQGRVNAFFAKLPAQMKPSDADIEHACNFFYDVQSLAMGGVTRQIGRNSDSPTIPTISELNRFCLIGKTNGWKAALETLKIYCDQDENFNSQWQLIIEQFNNSFGSGTVSFEPRK